MLPFECVKLNGQKTEGNCPRLWRQVNQPRCICCTAILAASCLCPASAILIFVCCWYCCWQRGFPLPSLSSLVSWPALPTPWRMAAGRLWWPQPAQRQCWEILP